MCSFPLANFQLQFLSLQANALALVDQRWPQGPDVSSGLCDLILVDPIQANQRRFWQKGSQCSWQRVHHIMAEAKFQGQLLACVRSAQELLKIST